MLKTYEGGCHCGRVRFRVTSDLSRVTECNCSICAMTGFLHIIVPESGFRLLSGAQSLTTYQFNTGVARHLFCSRCGVKSFYRPRSNPDGWSINARCLDEPSGLNLSITPFDGRHWEDHAAALAHLSKEAL